MRPEDDPHGSRRPGSGYGQSTPVEPAEPDELRAPDEFPGPDEFHQTDDLPGPDGPRHPENVDALDPTAPAAVPVGPHRRSGLVPRLLVGLLGAAVCTALTVLLAKGAVGTARGQRLDQLILSAAQNDDGPITQVIFPALNTVTVPVVLILLALAAVFALVRRRPSLLLQILVIVAGANLTVQIVKSFVVDRTALAQDIDVTPNSFPSGHTALAISVALSLILVCPARIRGLVAILGTAWVAAAGVGTIAGGWHRPSDVLGALLVTGAWAFLLLAVDAALALARTPRGPEGLAHPRDARAGRGAGPLLAVLGAVAVAAGMVVLATVPTPIDLDDASHQARAYLATVLVIPGCVAVLTAAALGLRVPDLARPAGPLSR
nr:phosphatase PAP2 family protein [Brachybacterium sp. ACRRE]